MVGTSIQATQSQEAMRDVVLVHSKAYLEALRLLPVHRSRERMTLALAHALGLLQPLASDENNPRGSKLQLVASTPASRAELEAFHCREFVDALVRQSKPHGSGNSSQLKTGAGEEEDPADELERFGLVDDAYAFPHLLHYCRFVTGASLTAANALLHRMRMMELVNTNDIEAPRAAPVVINLGSGGTTPCAAKRAASVT